MAEFRAATVKPPASLDDLSKLDIRVGTIRSVDDVANSKKLVRLTVSFGDHTRSILAGMKGERDDPTEEVSEGMLLDIGYADGITPVLALPERPVPDGARVG